jgi:hypothetical protein
VRANDAGERRVLGAEQRGAVRQGASLAIVRLCSGALAARARSDPRRGWSVAPQLRRGRVGCRLLGRELVGAARRRQRLQLPGRLHGRSDVDARIGRRARRRGRSGGVLEQRVRDRRRRDLLLGRE